MRNLNLILIGMITIGSFHLSCAQQVKGTGKVVTETISMKNISSIGLGISANVYIKPGSTQKIEIKGQQNIIDLIKKTPKGNSWNIEFENNVQARNYEELTIHITLTALENLSIGGSGSIVGEGQFSSVGNLGVSIGGSGSINLAVDAQDVVSSIGGSGTIELDGSAQKLKVSISGSGDVDAVNLKVRDCRVSSAGSGNAEVNVSESLDVSLVGSGGVKYKGSPKIKTTIVGSGEVKPF